MESLKALSLLVAIAIALGACGNSTGRPPQNQLIAAVMRGDIAEVESLLSDPNVDINWTGPKTGNTALSSAAAYNKVAARNGHVEVINLLLDAGADRRARIKDGRTALQLAQHYGHLNAANVLVFYQPGTAAH
jgi:uncharacterized protein